MWHRLYSENRKVLEIYRQAKTESLKANLALGFSVLVSLGIIITVIFS